MCIIVVYGIFTNTIYVGGIYEIYVRKRRYCIGTSSGIWVNAPVVNAASIAPDPKAAITEIAFDGEDGQIKYEVEGFDSTGKYELNTTIIQIKLVKQKKAHTRFL